MALERNKAQVEQTAQHAEGRAKDVAHSTWFRTLVTVGLITVGVVHILIGVLALQMAWAGGNDKEADQKGALAALASNPFGKVLMWIVAVAVFGLVIWKLTQAWWGYTWEDGSKRTRKRLGAVGGAIMYLFLGLTAVKYAMGSSEQDSDTKQQSRIGELLSQPFGQVLAGILAAIVIGYAGVLIKRGFSASFTKEYDGEPSSGVKRLGQVGYVAKGIAVGLVGGLFAWAAFTYDPEKAGGLDDALRVVKDQGVLGPILLTVVAIGLIAFGIYCFSWSRHARR